VADSDNGWLHKVAIALDYFTTAKDLAALLFDCFKTVYILFNGTLGVQWAY